MDCILIFTIEKMHNLNILFQQTHYDLNFSLFLLHYTFRKIRCNCWEFMSVNMAFSIEFQTLELRNLFKLWSRFKLKLKHEANNWSATKFQWLSTKQGSMEWKQQNQFQISSCYAIYFNEWQNMWNERKWHE